MWEHTFSGVCLSCRQWFTLTFRTTPGGMTLAGSQAPSLGIQQAAERRWWGWCFLCNSESGGKNTVAWKWSGGHLVDPAEPVAPQSATLA